MPSTEARRVAHRHLLATAGIIPHGRFKIINDHGYTSDEYAAPLEVLDAAADIVTKAGFGNCVYGEVELASVTHRFFNHAGLYQSDEDSIQLNVAVTPRFDLVYTLVHELGHRLWHKFLSSTARDQYEDDYFGAAKVITVADRELFWEALEKADFNARRTKALLPESLRPLFEAYWVGIKKKHKSDLPRTFPRGLPDYWYRAIVRPNARYVVVDPASVQSVTDYGKKNVREDFAEVFAHFCTKKPLTDDAKARFERALNP